MMLRPVRGAKAAAAPRKRYTMLRYVDRGVLICFIALLACGLLVLYAASYYNA